MDRCGFYTIQLYTVNYKLFGFNIYFPYGKRNVFPISIPHYGTDVTGKSNVSKQLKQR